VVADRLFSIALIGGIIGVRVIGEGGWTHLELVHPTIIASRLPPPALPLRPRGHHGLLVRHSGGRTRVLEHGIALKRVGAIRVADVHHDRRNEEAREKLERGTEKTGLPKKPESIRSNSDGNRREGGRTGTGSSGGREGRERIEENV
jgi:hypothetical protein